MSHQSGISYALFVDLDSRLAENTGKSTDSVEAEWKGLLEVVVKAMSSPVQWGPDTPELSNDLPSSVRPSARSYVEVTLILRGFT